MTLTDTKWLNPYADSANPVGTYQAYALLDEGAGVAAKGASLTTQLTKASRPMGNRARKEKLAGQAPTHPAHLRPRRHERESRSPLKAVRNAGLDVRFPYASSSALPAASRSFSMRRRE